MRLITLTSTYLVLEPPILIDYSDQVLHVS